MRTQRTQFLSRQRTSFRNVSEFFDSDSYGERMQRTFPLRAGNFSPPSLSPLIVSFHFHVLILHAVGSMQAAPIEKKESRSRFSGSPGGIEAFFALLKLTFLASVGSDFKLKT